MFLWINYVCGPFVKKERMGAGDEEGKINDYTNDCVSTKKCIIKQDFKLLNIF